MQSIQKTELNRQMVAQRFGKAIRTYEQEAQVQRYIAEKMIRLLKQTLHSSCERIAEFGCGTGFYSRLLNNELHPEFMVLNDLCKEMEICCSGLSCGEIEFLSGDAEEIHFPGRFDLITSCSTLQWFHAPQHFFKTCSHSLNNQGYLAFSTFGMENFKEIRTLTGHGLSYLSIQELQSMLSAEYRILHAEEEIIPLYFTSPMDVLYHLKRTGVTGAGKKNWTRRELIVFCEEYIQLFGYDGSVPLTYHPVYIIAHKKFTS